MRSRGVNDESEKVVSMNGFSSDRNYIVCPSWQQPNGTNANIFEVS
jgi:hypothetical protein